MSQLLRLDNSDWVKAGVVIVFSAVLAAMQQMLAAHGLSFAEWDWNFILGAAMTAGFGYLGKNFLSDKNGKVGGVIG